MVYNLKQKPHKRKIIKTPEFHKVNLLFRTRMLTFPLNKNLLSQTTHWSHVMNLNNILSRREKVLILTLMTLVAWMKLTAYKLCSSIPVPMVRIFGSKMMSFGLKPSLFTRRWQARVHTLILVSISVAQGKSEKYNLKQKNEVLSVETEAFFTCVKYQCWISEKNLNAKQPLNIYQFSQRVNWLKVPLCFHQHNSYLVSVKIVSCIYTCYIYK